MLLLKIAFLFVAVWFGTVNAVRSVQKIGVPAQNMVIFAAALTGFIVLQWLI